MKKRRKMWKSVAISVVLSLFVLIMLAFYAKILEKDLNEETVATLKEISGQTVAMLNEKIHGEWRLLSEVADRLEVTEELKPETAVSLIQEICERQGYKRMGVILPNGKAYTTDGKEAYLGERLFFRQSLNGQVSVSKRLEDKISAGSIIVFSVPIYSGDSVCGVLFATYDEEELRKLMAVNAFDGQGYAYIINRYGDAVVDANSSTGFKSFQNIYRSMNEVSETNIVVAAKLQKHILAGESGYVKVYNEVDKYMYYMPLDVQDWYVLCVVPTGVVDSTKDELMYLTYMLCILLILIFLLLIIYIVVIERKQKKELSDILYVDDITGGYSFARFCGEVPQRLQNTDLHGACIVMDVDKFKVINELFGYDEGNRTLCGVWKIWRKCSEDTEIYARRLADRFVALWYYKEREELNERLENFMEEVQNLVQENQMDYNLKITMGIYLIKDKEEDVQKMINYATMAHATVKGQDDIWYAFYDDDFREKLLKNKLLEDQMKKGLKNKEFVVYYQPKYHVMTGELVGAEALIRWKQPDGTMVQPGKFIPLAEKSGFISKLDQYVFAAVCKKQREWVNEGRVPVPVSVNLSRRHLYNDDFMEEYYGILKESGIPAEYVQLELTESAIFENQEALCGIIDRLHEMGFRILMDDFGTGYSSLMMLKSVPIDILKLDKSFVDDFDHEKGEKIITSVIQLAQSLHIEVTAEGVETEEQYRFLKALGCDMVQGFYFARPMPEEEFEKLLCEGKVELKEEQLVCITG